MNDEQSVSQAHPPPVHSSTGSEAAHAAQAGPFLFGTHLEPALQQACDRKLSTVYWFRTDWQRGGALTGHSTFHDGQREHPVVVKLPIPPVEKRWLVQLQSADDVVPRVYCHGDSLGGYDMCWVVMERLPHGPLSHAWGGRAFDLIIDAAVRFAIAARQVPADGELRHRDYHHIRNQARENIHRHGIAHEQRWNKALKAAHRKLDDWLPIWQARRADEWCHGDLHFGNSMTRAAPPQGPALLLDFAEVHRGHWIEDAVHLEHLYWGRRDKLEGHRICKEIARARKARGLPVEEDWPKLAQIYRALLALCTPAILRFVGDPHHVEAALELLEAEVG